MEPSRVVGTSVENNNIDNIDSNNGNKDIKEKNKDYPLFSLIEASSKCHDQICSTYYLKPIPWKQHGINSNIMIALNPCFLEELPAINLWGFSHFISRNRKYSKYSYINCYQASPTVYLHTMRPLTNLRWYCLFNEKECILSQKTMTSVTVDGGLIGDIGTFLSLGEMWIGRNHHFFIQENNKVSNAKPMQYDFLTIPARLARTYGHIGKDWLKPLEDTGMGRVSCEVVKRVKDPGKYRHHQKYSYIHKEDRESKWPRKSIAWFASLLAGITSGIIAMIFYFAFEAAALTLNDQETIYDQGIKYSASPSFALYDCDKQTGYWPWVNSTSAEIVNACDLTSCTESPRNDLYCLMDNYQGVKYYSTLIIPISVKTYDYLKCRRTGIEHGHVYTYDGDQEFQIEDQYVSATEVTDSDEYIYILPDGREILSSIYHTETEAKTQVSMYLNPGQMKCTSTYNNNWTVYRGGLGGGRSEYKSTLSADFGSWMSNIDDYSERHFYIKDLRLAAPTVIRVVGVKVCAYYIRDGVRTDWGSCWSGGGPCSASIQTKDLYLDPGLYAELDITVQEGCVVNKNMGIESISPQIPSVSNYDPSPPTLEIPDPLIGSAIINDNGQWKQPLHTTYTVQIQEKSSDYICPVLTDTSIVFDICDSNELRALSDSQCKVYDKGGTLIKQTPFPLEIPLDKFNPKNCIYYKIECSDSKDYLPYVVDWCPETGTTLIEYTDVVGPPTNDSSFFNNIDAGTIYDCTYNGWFQACQGIENIYTVLWLLLLAGIIVSVIVIILKCKHKACFSPLSILKRKKKKEEKRKKEQEEINKMMDQEPDVEQQEGYYRNEKANKASDINCHGVIKQKPPNNGTQYNKTGENGKGETRNNTRPASKRGDDESEEEEKLLEQTTSDDLETQIGNDTLFSAEITGEPMLTISEKLH